MKLYRIYALMMKYWYITIRNSFRTLEMFYWPLMGMLVWGFTSIYISDLVRNNALMNVFLGGAVLWLFFTMAQEGIGIFVLEDIWNRNISNLFASPIKIYEFIISTALFGLIRCLLSFAFLIAIAYLLYSFNVLSVGVFYLSIFAFGLVLFGWVVGIFITSLIFRYGTRAQSLLWAISWLIQPFSAVFYPVSSLPIWLQKISLIFPSTHIFEGMRAAFNKSVLDLNSLILSFTINIILLIAAYFFFESSVNSAKRKGMLTKYHE